jgi:hypothetical protein
MGEDVLVHLLQRRRSWPAPDLDIPDPRLPAGGSRALQMTLYVRWDH